MYDATVKFRIYDETLSMRVGGWWEEMVKLIGRECISIPLVDYIKPEALDVLSSSDFPRLATRSSENVA